jgi:N-acetyl sugar amidotransferase
VIGDVGELDLSLFKKTNQELTDADVRYGLPKKVQFCQLCVESNQRPSTTVEFKNTPNAKKDTILFDQEGVCSACRFGEKKSLVDWEERDKELIELCNRFRRNDGRYDCIVPGSGGKDSVLVAHELKYKYKMHPLTVTWAPHIYTPWGKKNHDSWIHSGQDNVLVTPNGKVHRLLTRLAIDVLFHPFQPFMLGQKSLAPKIASAMGIPLIFYGESEAEYGSPAPEKINPRQENKFFSGEKVDEMYISGISVKQLLRDFGLEQSDLAPYLPLDTSRLKDIEVHYFGHYRKWHPQAAYYYAVENIGFVASPERTPGTYSKYSSIDDKVDDLHYYTTGIKFGRGRATENAAQEIRSGDITRDEGVRLVKKFDLEYPERFEEELFNYLTIDSKNFSVASLMFEHPCMDRDYFMKLSDHFRSPHLWLYGADGWELRNTVWQ